MDIKIHIEEVPENSLKWQIYTGKYEENEYLISGLIEPDGKGGCEIANVQGDMTNESNELMATTVRDLGFDYLTFNALKGTKVTHYAEKIGEDEYLEYYKVPLKGQTTDDGR